MWFPFGRTDSAGIERLLADERTHKEKPPSFLQSSLNFVIGAAAESALMFTWCGLSSASIYFALKRLAPPKVLSQTLTIYGSYFVVTRALWMNNTGRFLRPNLPRKLQEFLLLTLTSSAIRWHRPARLQVVRSKPSSKHLATQCIYLAEPHGVGNGILASVHHITTTRIAYNADENNSSPTVYNSPVVLGSKNVCLVPFLVEFTWLFCGADGMEFAENILDIRRAINSNRDITLVPSGFSSIGMGGRVDWRRRKRLFKFVRAEAKREKKKIALVPILWFYELVCYKWYLLRGSFWERARVKARLPLGGFAVGYGPFFFLPKRVPMLIGEGRPVIVGHEEEEEGADSASETTSDAREVSSDVSSEVSGGSPARRGKQHCGVCDVKFTLMNRRHHCRNCAIHCCGECGKHEAVVVNRAYADPSGVDVPVRVCSDCVKVLLVDASEGEGGEEEGEEEKEEEEGREEEEITLEEEEARAVEDIKEGLGQSYQEVFERCMYEWNRSAYCQRRVEKEEWEMQWKSADAGLS